MRKIILSLLGILLVIAAIFGAKMIIESNTVERPPLKKITKTVFIDIVENRTVPIIIPANGMVTALNKTELFSEVEGVFRSSSKPFRPGQNYLRGQLLLRIDASEFAANVRAARSGLYNTITAIMPDLRLDYPEIYPKWEQYLNNLDVNKNLAPLPETSSNQEKYFISGRGVNAAYYNIKNLEARLNKFTIIAPYTGTLTEALVTEGSLVRPGQKLGEYIDPSEFELEVAISKSFSDLLKIGEKVNLTNLEKTQSFEGVVSRINNRIDPSSQTIQVFINIGDPAVREGMYLEASLEAREIENAIEIPRELLVDQNKVYVLNDSVLELREVEPVYFAKEKVVVRGLESGAKLISSPVPGAYSGMLVEVDKNPKPVKSL
jgi:multidrug efflux pump subunit AcrA (membrane-fusion protein)